jgi:hypothetical protein
MIIHLHLLPRLIINMATMRNFDVIVDEFNVGYLYLGNNSNNNNDSGRGLCDELVPRPEETYRVLCVVR